MSIQIKQKTNPNTKNKSKTNLQVALPHNNPNNKSLHPHLLRQGHDLAEGFWGVTRGGAFEHFQRFYQSKINEST